MVSDLKRDYQEIMKNKKTSAFLLILAIILMYYVTFMQKNFIVVLDIEGPLGTTEANKITETLDSLQRNTSVRAVVLRVNSPGGTASAVHEIYFKILSLKQTKPIVTFVDTGAASGAYYIILPTHFIFSKQSSDVGSIGVIAERPTEVEKKDILTSGPFKAMDREEDVLRSIELLKDDFLNVVQINRKDKLKISAEELASARIFIGFDAKKFGLVDELGGLDDAIAKAKELAGLKKAEVVVETPARNPSPFSVSSNFFSNTTSAPVYYYLYIKLGETK